jgi:hypothetical protein
MIESKDIRKMVDHVIRRQQGVADRESMDPAREWLLGIVVTGVFVCVGGVVSYVLYDRTVTLEVATEASAPSIPYNAARVQAAIDWYEARAVRYGALRGDAPAAPVTTLDVPPTVVPDETPAPDPLPPGDAATTTEPVVEPAVPVEEVPAPALGV